MKKFLKKAIVFLILFVSIFIVSPYFLVRNFSKFTISPKKTILIVGHSHSTCAYNDKYLDDVFNISNNTEGYFYNYIKVKKVLEQNKHISSVLIEFSNNSIDYYKNHPRWHGKKEFLKFPRFAPFMEKEDYKHAIKQNLNGFIKAIPKCFKNNLEIFGWGFDYSKHIGGFKTKSVSKINSILLDSKNIDFLLHSEQKLAKENLKYLNILIGHCKKENVTPILIRSPLHKKYHGYNNEELFSHLLTNDYKDLKFLDFSKYPGRNSEFLDLSHLNSLGSEKFSTWFNRMLNNGILTNPESQLIINEEFEKIKNERTTKPKLH